MKSAIEALHSVRSAATHRAATAAFTRRGLHLWLKRSFGLARCTWSGFESFQAYVWASALSANLLLMARRTLE